MYMGCINLARLSLRLPEIKQGDLYGRHGDVDEGGRALFRNALGQAGFARARRPVQQHASAIRPEAAQPSQMETSVYADESGLYAQSGSTIQAVHRCTSGA